MGIEKKVEEFKNNNQTTLEWFYILSEYSYKNNSTIYGVYRYIGYQIKKDFNLGEIIEVNGDIICKVRGALEGLREHAKEYNYSYKELVEDIKNNVIRRI